MFTGFVALHEHCPRCAVRFERYAGSWTLAPWLAISVGVTVSALLVVLCWTRGWLFPGWELAIGALSTAAALLSYRPIKGGTFGMLHAVGLVTPDPVQVGNVVYLDRFRQQRGAGAQGAVAARRRHSP